MRPALALLALIGLLAPAHRARAQAQASSDIPVMTSTARLADVPVFLKALGQVQAFQQVLVRARVDGTLDSIDFTEGQEVKPGDLLAEIDPRPYQAALDAALAKRASDQAQLVSARLDMTRYANLAQKQFASQQQVDQQRATVSGLEATLQGDDAAIATARLNLEFTRISSPVAGRIGLRMTDIGNLIHANDVAGIVTITQTKPISMTFTVPQDQLPAIAAAMKKRHLPVLAYAPDDKTLLGVGELLTPDNAIDPGTGTIKLKATFPNPEETLWPGQFVNARLLLDTLPQSVTIPSVAVQHGPDGLFTFVVRSDNTVAMQPIKVKQDDGTIAVVESGVTPGDAVVVNGQSKIQAGSHVAVKEVSGGTAASAAPPQAGG